MWYRRWISVVPSAFRAASTRAADARRSGRHHGAPLRESTPEMTAVPLSTLMLAPALQFGAVMEALRENSVFHDGNAGCRGKQGRHLRLHVRGVAGIGGRLDFAAFRHLSGNDGDGVPAFVKLHMVPALAEQAGNDGPCAPRTRASASRRPPSWRPPP